MSRLISLTTGQWSDLSLEELCSTVEKLGYDKINNEKLKALMKLRKSHPDATLDELAKMLSEELAAEVSKSNVNHLFRYLDEEYRKATSNGRKR